MSSMLIGKTLTGMKIADDKEATLFNTSDGDWLVKEANGAFNVYTDEAFRLMHEVSV